MYLFFDLCTGSLRRDPECFFLVFILYFFFQNCRTMAAGKDFKYFYEDEVWRLNRKVGTTIFVFACR